MAWFLEHRLFFCCYFSVPGDPPQNFGVAVINSTAVQLRWIQPSLPYGVITAYHISYNLTSIADDYVTVDAQKREHVVTSLNEYTVYSFTMYASTRIGDGPLANAVSRTNESCELIILNQ